LKRSKKLSSVLLKRHQSAETIKDILDKIDEAHTNKEILDAYRVGTSSIKDTTKRLGLNVEAIDEVMLDLAEVMADQREIDEAMKTGVETDQDQELEEELQQLMNPITISASPTSKVVTQMENITLRSPSSATKMRAPVTEYSSEDEVQVDQSTKSVLLA